jgi:hypothetical protein
LLGWNWNLEKSIATGTHNSESLSIILSRGWRHLASAPRLPGRLLFSALFAAALAQSTNEPSDHERGQQERDDHAYTD